MTERVRGNEHRSDVDGLRAVAILAVVAYHAGVRGASGGFVGVDVFFVISGYLITRNLVAEAGSSGRIRLVQFWGRRIRRLVPALALMIVGVIALSTLVLSPLEWRSVGRDGRGAALYVSNLMFARDSTDYFGGDVSSSLFLHTWSLGVEEQFYLVWPVLVGLVVMALRSRPERRRPALAALFTVVLGASLWHSVVLTADGSPHGFFGLPSRAWEFAVAGLIALLPAGRLVRHKAAGTTAAAAGLVLIVGATVGLDHETRYPGLWALIPVGGTLLVIIAGSAGGSAGWNPASAALGVKPLQWLGRVSYSWYLWHWPLILLAVDHFDEDALWVTLGASAVALAIGAATHAWVENPVRWSPKLGRSLPRTAAMGATATVAALLAGSGLLAYSDSRLEDLAASSGTPSVTLAEVRESQREFDCAAQPSTASGVEYCLDGDVDGTRTLLLVGDSHARQWKPALADIGQRNDIRVIVRWRSVCPAFPVNTILFGGGSGVDHECAAFRDDTDRLIDEIRPDAVIIATSNDYGYLVVNDEAATVKLGRAELWEQAYDSFVGSLRDRGMAVGSIVDTPRNGSDPLDCIAERGPDGCATPRADALTGHEYTEAEAAVRARRGDIAVLDLTEDLCNSTHCPVVIDGQYVYTDFDHLYAPFTMTLAPRIEELVDQLLPR